MKVLATIVGILLAGSSYVQAQENCNPNPPNGMGELAAYSIFQGNYQNGDYPFALNYGRWMLCKKSKTMEGNPRFNLSTQFSKLIKIYTEIGLEKQDPSEREAYIDSALMIFDMSFELFTDQEQDKYELHQRRGRYFLENYRNIENGLQRAYQDFEAMFEMDAERTTKLAKGYYLRVTLDNMVRDDERKQEVVDMIEKAKPFATEEQLSYFDEKLNDVFDSPEERLGFCKDKLEADPNSIDDLKCVADAQEALNMQQDLVVTLKKIHSLSPTFDSALSLADIEKGNASYKEAAELYKEALASAPDDRNKKEINLDLADVYSSMDDLKTAKTYINAALKIDSNYGLAYLKMANIYGQAVSKCTENRKLEAKDKVVYWVVVDYLNKAKQVDSSVSNAVTSQLATYEAVTPSTEDKFFTLGFEQGQKVKVDSSLMSCYSWINETTTVR